jgi:hypothetical protein
MKQSLPPGVHFFVKGQSRALIGFLAFFEIGFLIGILLFPSNLWFWIAALVLLFVSINLSSLQVVIDDQTLYVIYGIGLFQKIVDIHTLEFFNLVPNNTLHALYNTSAKMALKVTDRDGRVTTVGIGETRAMLEFMQSRSRGG